ncbi:uncharacterized protein LOC129725696 [Wyeomyia smithii]|uniref:uncharacterized protein LOC129725696 n=1 Tax=Wyeomyia smithii TaxID=174621 RepID=UPI002467CE1A|nr:uncharacterized protein LOC129725696 [Wyeomyia smithii]
MVTNEKRVKKWSLYISEYNFQLSAYANFIRRLSTTAVLDRTMIEQLEDLINQLEEISNFKAFQESNETDNNINDISLIIKCTFCPWYTINGEQLLLHIMNSYHKKNSRLSRFQTKASAGYREYIGHAKTRITNNRLPESTLGDVIGFHFLTKSFWHITDKYLRALQALGLKPTFMIAHGVNELLSQIDCFISSAKCVESIQSSKSLLMTYNIWDIGYKYREKVYTKPVQAFQDLSNPLPDVPPRNVFSLPSNAFPSMNLNNQQNFQTNPLQQGVPICPTHLPTISVPPNNTVYRNQSGIQQLLYDPSKPPPIIPPQNHQKQPPTQRNRTETSPLLPPLHEQNNEDLVRSEHLKQFLQDPSLGSLIKIGNILSEFEKTTLILSDIKSALKETSSNVTVSLFGSKVSGVGYEEDPLNICVDDGNKIKTLSRVESLLNKLKEFFVDNPEEWSIVNTTNDGIHSCIYVKNHCESVCCQISFTSGIYCCNTQIIRYYVRTFPIFQKMCYFLNELSRMLKLSFHQHLVVLLVVFYLQTENFLPTVTQLQLPEEQIDEDWNISFNPKKPPELKLTECESDLRKCVAGFFNYYGNKFSFSESVVSPHVGTPVKRVDFTPNNEWRLPFERYRQFLNKKLPGASDQMVTSQRFNATTPMCVQDMLNLSKNIAETVTAQDTDKFVKLCQELHLWYTNNK